MDATWSCLYYVGCIFVLDPHLAEHTQILVPSDMADVTTQAEYNFDLDQTLGQVLVTRIHHIGTVYLKQNDDTEWFVFS